MSLIAISADTDGAWFDQAKALADRLSLPLVDSDNDSASWLLVYGEEGLALHSTRQRQAGISVDFVGGKADWRRRHGGGKGQAIARAFGLHKGARPAIVDATAGLGRDGFVLASLGCDLTLIERSPVVHALLEDGLRRLGASEDPDVAAIAGRMTLHLADGRSWLASSEKVSTVYLDPMFPGDNKMAGVKKEMQAFRDLLDEQQDESELLAAALAAAEHRVVVKRPRKAPPIEGPEPSLQLKGSSTRFDIYALKKYY